MKTIRRISRFLTQMNITVFLYAAYVLGIGIVSVLGRTVGARFLDEDVAHTNWKRPTGSTEMERMF